MYNYSRKSQICCLFFLVVTLCTACTATDLSPEQACLQKGGTWEQRGLLATYQCNIKTKDAGKPCRDSSECESICIAGSAATIGSKVIGSCFSDTIYLGTCLSRVKAGIVQPKLCVD